MNRRKVTTLMSLVVSLVVFISLLAFSANTVSASDLSRNENIISDSKLENNISISLHWLRRKIAFSWECTKSRRITCISKKNWRLCSLCQWTVTNKPPYRGQHLCKQSYSPYQHCTFKSIRSRTKWLQLYWRYNFSNTNYW